MSGPLIRSAYVQASKKERPLYPYEQLFMDRLAYERERNEVGYNSDAAALILESKEIGRTTAAYKAYSVGRLPAAHTVARAQRYVAKRILRDLWCEGARILREQGWTPAPPGRIGWVKPDETGG